MELLTTLLGALPVLLAALPQPVVRRLGLKVHQSSREAARTTLASRMDQPVGGVCPRCAVDWAAPIYCSLPPYPPPMPPRAPPPLLPPPAPCGDQLAGRQQLRDGRTAKHCWELPSSHVACERYYSNTSAGTALCVAPAESEAAVCGQSGFILDCTVSQCFCFHPQAVCGQSDFILDCISPPPSPPSPPSPPPSPAAPSPGRPISALEAAIGIDTSLTSTQGRVECAASLPEKSLGGV